MGVKFSDISKKSERKLFCVFSVWRYIEELFNPTEYL
jgi:hypothetical protein